MPTKTEEKTAEDKVITARNKNLDLALQQIAKDYGDILSVDCFNDKRSQRYVVQDPVTGLSSGVWVDAGTLPVSLSSSALGFEMGAGFLLRWRGRMRR